MSTCYQCGEEGHFARNCPNSRGQAQGQTNYRQGGGGGGSTCYNCGMTGHFARECPTAGGERAPAPMERSKTCYACGEAGHMARDCPNAQGGQTYGGAGGYQAGGYGGGRQYGGRPRRSNGPKCYNCGEFGHISKDCPNGQKGPKCYQCGGFGHISKDCPNPKTEEKAEGMEVEKKANGEKEATTAAEKK